MSALPTAGIIDSDIHLAETPADLAPYTDLPWRHAVADPGANPPWSLNGALYPRLGAAPPAANLIRAPADLARYLTGTGIAAGIVLSTTLLKIGSLPTAAYAAALARAYNRWLDAVWLGSDARIYGAIVAAPQDPEDAAREITRYSARRKVAGVLLPLAGVDPLWGDRCYDPIYAAAVAAGRPVLLHGGGEFLLPGMPGIGTVFATAFEQQALSAPLLAMAHLVSMTATGVFARFPDLRVVFLEAGLSWFAHIMLRMDKEYNENRRDIPYYADRVSAYLKRQVWLGTHPLEAGPRAVDLLEIIRVSCGLDRVLYTSHTPFVDRDPPARVAAAFPDAAARDRVMAGNAAALFGIAVDNLGQPTVATRQGA